MSGQPPASSGRGSILKRIELRSATTSGKATPHHESGAYVNVTPSRGSPLSLGLVCRAASANGVDTSSSASSPAAASPVSRTGAPPSTTTSTELAKSGAGPLPSANSTNSQAASRRA